LHGNGRPGHELPYCGNQRLAPVQIAGRFNIKKSQEVWVYSADVLFRNIFHSDILVESGDVQVVGLQSLFDVRQALFGVQRVVRFGGWFFNTGTTAPYPSQSESMYGSSSARRKGMAQATTRLQSELVADNLEKMPPKEPHPG